MLSLTAYAYAIMHAHGDKLAFEGFIADPHPRVLLHVSTNIATAVLYLYMVCNLDTIYHMQSY